MSTQYRLAFMPWEHFVTLLRYRVVWSTLLFTAYLWTTRNVFVNTVKVWIWAKYLETDESLPVLGVITEFHVFVESARLIKMWSQDKHLLTLVQSWTSEQSARRKFLMSHSHFLCDAMWILKTKKILSLWNIFKSSSTGLCTFSELTY